MNPLRHIAIIPDGNRRWAKKKGVPEFFGHREGAKTAEKILKTALDEGISHLTFWGLSLDNVQKRSKAELKFLFAIFEEQFKKLLTHEVIQKKDVRIRFLGRWEETFPESTRHVMEEVMRATRTHTRHHLTFLMAYNGFDEMVQAIQSIQSKASVTQGTIKKHLWTKDLPAVDLVIRTGGEPHWSNGFMMWDVGDAQLHFTETLWPNFSSTEFGKAIRQFKQNGRRFGK